MRNLNKPNISMVLWVLLLTIIIPQQNPFDSLCIVLLIGSTLTTIDENWSLNPTLLLFPCLVPTFDTPELAVLTICSLGLMTLCMYPAWPEIIERLDRIRKIQFGDFITLAITPTFAYTAFFEPRFGMALILWHCAWWASPPPPPPINTTTHNLIRLANRPSITIG